ncbi:hypothetical protein TNCV_4149931 [Trichonephila clavipes]|uniref:Uncharacterized protein n=1 Tax=Trichonephila clavipes TaxID=2585209 RepID=A0A8X7BFJ7_TRICX|nr:hypothetical protein TNCV_4149931 [Trichonephila clavipes]
MRPSTSNNYYIPSYVDVEINELSSILAKVVAWNPSISSAPLTYLELFSRKECKDKALCSVPPQDYWYQSHRLGGFLTPGYYRQDKVRLVII